MRIAVLDNDKARADQICRTLQAIGHACQVVDHKDLPDQVMGDAFELLIMDEQNGNAGDRVPVHKLQACRQMNLPVLLIASRAEEDVIRAALDAGASDYIVKPLRLGELAMRVQVLLKRAYPEHAAGEQFRFGPYVFETATGRATFKRTTINVTQKEFELALLFFRNLGRPLSRATIQEAIWSQEPNLASRTMDTHVSRVRNKLRLRPENGFRLAPVYGYGYQLEQLPE